MKKYLLLCLFSCLFFCRISAQEGIRPLHGNTTRNNSELSTAKHVPSVQFSKNAAGMQIPFKEDFYYAPQQSFPNTLLWEDSTVFINSGFPIAPPSIGVATFDGLNKYGYPYAPNLTNMSQSFPADQLTSRAIDLKTSGTGTLQPSDSVAISFFYQARGRGENPELNDSLILDFYKPNQGTWSKRVWFSRGNNSPNTNDTIFKKGFVWISDTAFLQSNFKIRFRNTATTSGDFDHWHLDYIYIDKLRTQLGDSTYNDISIGHVPTSYLTNYSAMPLKQYTTVEKAVQNTVFIRNNNLSAPDINTTYEYRMFDDLSNAQIFTYYGGAHNLEPFKYKGWDPHGAHAKPSFTLSDFPTVTSDSVDYRIKHFVSRGTPSASDFSLFNDTVMQYQRFRNYYAFDDGSAEGGYYVLGSGGRMVQKIKVNVGDTLRALRIYFDPVGNYNTTQKFRMHVYTDNGGAPAFLMHVDSALTNVVKHYTVAPRTSLQEYKFQYPVFLSPGTYYIGIQQFVATGITVGFDKNTNHSNMLYFDSGNGWVQSSIYGSLMMRPVFGPKILPPVGLDEKTEQLNLFTLYPNPANTEVNIELSAIAEATYTIYNTVGQKISEGKLEKENQQINISSFENGLYYLQIQTSDRRSMTRKLLIRH